MSKVVCVCGKKKGNLNSINWSRHKQSCKLLKTKCENVNIINFFKRSNSSDPNTTTDVKKKRTGKY